MTRSTTDTTTATDEALVATAGRSDEAAFAELHARHAPMAWRLALAITGDPDLAGRAVVEGTGTLFTALRAGRAAPHPHGVALASATRNAALDLRVGVLTVSRAVPDDADAVLAAAFASLPERWRSVLWLRDAEGRAAAEVATIVELSTEAVDQLAVRARRGLRERYLRGLAGAADGRACTRAVARLGALEDGTLAERDATTLERHLAGCGACVDRRERTAALPTALPALALPVPGDLRERARQAWAASLASATRTGLSPRVEKVLAGASAMAAALGIIGAAVFGSGGDDEPSASPLAPLVADIETPRPVDLSELALPLLSPAPVAGADALDRRAIGTTSLLPRRPSATAPTAGGEIAAPVAPGAPAAPTTPGTPAVEGPAAPQLPIGVDPEDGVTVGPIGVDLSPEDGTVLDLPLPEPLAPVAPVVDAANQVLSPVVGAVEPVTSPVLQATQPVLDAVTDVVGSLGL